MENSGIFSWTSKGSKWIDPSINAILKTDCGYSDKHEKFKKPNRIIFMHLVSPRIDWQGYGKVQIDFKPFSSIGNVIYNACKGGMRLGRSKGKNQTEILTEFLRDRYNAFMRDKNIIVTDRWTPSDVWYGCRPIMLDYGIEIGPNTRKNFTGKIRPLCEKLFKMNMEEIGIFAADRAQLYFSGRWYDVGFDELDALKLKGTDLIIIEKEGMAETLTPLADRYGWALLFTRGFATKYVRDLSELSKNAGCNVSVLSDYDASGMLLSSKVKAPRMGIDPDTITYFEIEREDVEEKYDPGNHIHPIYGLVSEEEYQYLSHNRIEINSVKKDVGTEEFWKWITERIKEISKKRNYNRAIDVPAVVTPDDLKEVYNIIEHELEKQIEHKVDEEKEKLTDVKGFIDDVPQKRIDIEERLKKVITENPHYPDFISKFSELVESHHFLNNSESW